MPRRLILLLAALTVLALTSLAGIASAASTGVEAQNSVGALQTAGPSITGASGPESSCLRPGSAAGSARIASGFCVATEEGSGPEIGEGQAGHMFREAPGHLAEDTPENRALIEGVANNPDNYVGTDSNGVATYRELLPDGKQAWAEVYNGQITNGGVNDVPR